MVMLAATEAGASFWRELAWRAVQLHENERLIASAESYFVGLPAVDRRATRSRRLSGGNSMALSFALAHRRETPASEIGRMNDDGSRWVEEGSR